MVLICVLQVKNSNFPAVFRFRTWKGCFTTRTEFCAIFEPLGAQWSDDCMLSMISPTFIFRRSLCTWWPLKSKMAATLKGDFVAAILDFRGHQVQSDLRKIKVDDFIDNIQLSLHCAPNGSKMAQNSVRMVKPIFRVWNLDMTGKWGFLTLWT